jgi:hypothetical protein
MVSDDASSFEKAAAKWAARADDDERDFPGAGKIDLARAAEAIEIAKAIRAGEKVEFIA